MLKIDRTEVRKLGQDLRTEAAGYNRQWTLWLGVGSGGGAIGLLSFATKLPDPDYALRALLPAIVCFAGGVVFAGFAVLTAGLRIGAAELHYGAASNRDELDDAIARMPEVVSSPPSLSREINAPRDDAIKGRHQQHDDAERSWKKHVRWKFVHRACMLASAILFVGGVVLPLMDIATGKPFAPSEYGNKC